MQKIPFKNQPKSPIQNTSIEARRRLKEQIPALLKDGWTLHPFIIENVNGEKKCTPLTTDGRQGSPRIVIKSVEDLGQANAVLAISEKYPVLDIDDLDKIKLPKDFPKPYRVVRSFKGYHLYFHNGDIERPIKLNGGELQFKRTGVFLPGSYHPVGEMFYEVIKENNSKDKLYQKDIQQFLKKSTRKNKYTPGHRNTNLNRDVFIDVAKNKGENIPKIIKLYEKSGLDYETDIKPTVNSAVKGALRDKTFIEDEKKEKIIYTPAKTIEQDIKNRLKALKIQVRYNIREQLDEIKYGESPWQNMDDGKDKKLYSDIHQNLKCEEDKVKKITIADWNQHLTALIHRNEIDPFKEYLASLPKWDNKRRIDNVLSELFTVKSNLKIAQWAFKTVLLMAVIRTFEPGKKFDEMITLVGPQGIGKSSLWSCLFKNYSWFSDSVSFGDRDKEILESAFGCVIIENSEMAGTRKAEREKIKSFITRQVDKMRGAYKRRVSVVPRQFVVVGTTNEPKSLINDDTGNRRFVPITLDLKEATAQSNGQKVRKTIIEQRDNLWSEAFHLYRNKESHFLPTDLYDIAKKEAENNRFSNTLLEDSVIEFLSTKSKLLEPKQTLVVRMNQIIKHIVDEGIIPKGGAHPGIQREIAGILRKQGMTDQQRTEIDKNGRKKTWRFWSHTPSK